MQDLAAPDVAGENAQMRLVADIHAHDLAHDTPQRENFLKRGKRRHDRAEHGDVLVRKAVRGARGEGKAIAHAVRQHDGNGDVVRIACRLELRDDVVSVVGQVRKPGENPFVEAMRLGERTVSRRFRAAVVPEDMLARRTAELPDARIGRALGVPEFDGADRLVDRQAGVAEFQRKALDNDVWVGNVTRFADQPVAYRKRQAKPLVGQYCGKVGHGPIP